MGGVGETKLRSGEENVIFFVVSVFLSLLCVTAKIERERDNERRTVKFRKLDT
jgi:hypothetical protein